MVTVAIIRMVTIPPQGLGPQPHHPIPSLHHQNHQEKGPGTPGPPVPALASLVVITLTAIITMGKSASRERGKSTVTGLRGHLHIITRTGGRRSIMIIGQGAETIITRKGGGKMTSVEEIRIEEDPAVTGRSGQASETKWQIPSISIILIFWHTILKTDPSAFMYLYQDNMYVKCKVSLKIVMVEQ